MMNLISKHKRSGGYFVVIVVLLLPHVCVCMYVCVRESSQLPRVIFNILDRLFVYKLWISVQTKPNHIQSAAAGGSSVIALHCF